MLAITDQLSIPDGEYEWRFARAGGPGGQNVNKVESKAILIWQLAASGLISDQVKSRIRELYPRFVTNDGAMIISSQRHRDQERNREDCVEKLRGIIRESMKRPRVRRPTKPTKASRRRRLEGKKHRAGVKHSRRPPRLE